GGEDADVDVHVEIVDELHDERGLLRVLLAEVGAVGADDVEKLQADRGDAAEVAGPEGALEPVAEPFDVDPGRIPLGVQLLGGGREQDVDALAPGYDSVVRLVARVGGEVAGGVELRRVDEEAGDHELALGARGAEEGDMAGGEGAHGRDEPDLARTGKRLARLGDRPHRPHPASSAVASASVLYSGSSAGSRSRMTARCASTVAQSPREIGPVSSKPFSIVRRMSGTSASGGAPAAAGSSAAASCSGTR